MKILFVCTGNTCRSPMAQIVGKKLINGIEFDSAGVFAIDGTEISDNAKKVLLEKGYNSGDFKSKRVTKEIFKDFNLILTMTQEQKEILKTFFLEEKDKIYTLKEYNSDKEEFGEIADPFGGDLQIYTKILLDIELEILKLKSRLTNNS